LAALLGDKPIQQNVEEALKQPDSAASDAHEEALAGVAAESTDVARLLEDGAPVASAGDAEERRAKDLAEAPNVEAIRDLPVIAVHPNPRQPRRSFDPEALAELARSIASTGIVQPIIVRPQMGGSYELIAGERRWRAAQMAGYTAVPAIVRELSDVESLEISLIENVVRQQLNPMDEAFALHVLLEDLGVTQESLADRIGKSRSALANKIRLLDLPAEVQSLIIEGSLSEGHGRALLGVTGRGAQLRLARRAAKEGLSVRRIEGEVRKMAEGSGKRMSSRRELPASLVEGVRERFFGTLEVVPKLHLSGDGEAGRIELPFRDLAELQRILDRLDT
jgi:ParB family chromosome partitioning protein